MFQPRPDADRLAESDGAATAEADHAVGAALFRVGQRFVRDVCGRVHGCFGEEAGGLDRGILQDRLELLDLVCLLGCREQ